MTQIDFTSNWMYWSAGVLGRLGVSKMCNDDDQEHPVLQEEIGIKKFFKNLFTTFVFSFYPSFIYFLIPSKILVPNFKLHLEKCAVIFPVGAKAQ